MLEVKFKPPVLNQKGTVTIEMDADLAAKLRALVGQCNGGTFYTLYVELSKIPIAKLLLQDLAIMDDCIHLRYASWVKDPQF